MQNTVIIVPTASELFYHCSFTLSEIISYCHSLKQVFEYFKFGPSCHNEETLWWSIHEDLSSLLTCIEICIFLCQVKVCNMSDIAEMYCDICVCVKWELVINPSKWPDNEKVPMIWTAQQFKKLLIQFCYLNFVVISSEI